MSGQLELELPVACKVDGCTADVVGSSITGAGHVCRRHNEREWGEALARNRDPYYARLGQRLIATASSREQER